MQPCQSTGIRIKKKEKRQGEKKEMNMFMLKALPHSAGLPNYATFIQACERCIVYLKTLPCTEKRNRGLSSSVT